MGAHLHAHPTPPSTPPPPVGWCFGLVAWRGSKIVGVATVGRPVARRLAGAWEVTRVCTLPTSAAFGAASKIYRAAVDEVVRRGGSRLLTYTLAEESGASLRHAGWSPTATVPGASWNCASRPRNLQGLMPWEKKPQTGDKIRWEAKIVNIGEGCEGA